MTNAVNIATQDSLNYSQPIKAIQGKSVVPAVKEFARSLGNVFSEICGRLQSLSSRVENLESSRQVAVNLAKHDLNDQEKIQKLSPLITKLGGDIVRQSFSNYDEIKGKVVKYSEEQRTRYGEQDMADFAPGADETFDAIKYNYERSYGSLFLTQLAIHPEIKKTLGEDLPLVAFSSPIEVENELIREKVEALKAKLEDGVTKNLDSSEKKDVNQKLTMINLELVTKKINIDQKNIFPNLLLSVALEPKYTDDQRKSMVEAALNYVFSSSATVNR